MKIPLFVFVLVFILALAWSHSVEARGRWYPGKWLGRKPPMNGVFYRGHAGQSSGGGCSGSSCSR